MPDDTSDSNLTPLPSEAPWWMKYISANAWVIHKQLSTWFGVVLAVLVALPLDPDAASLIQQIFTPKQYIYVKLGFVVAAIVSKLIPQRKPWEASASTMASTKSLPTLPSPPPQ